MTNPGVSGPRRLGGAPPRRPPHPPPPPPPAGPRRAAAPRATRTGRAPWGTPSIYAAGDEALFFGFGYALAQDRLFQLDYLRRRGSGRLAEVLGADGADLDLLARVV